MHSGLLSYLPRLALILSLGWLMAAPNSARAEAMLQYFNTSWAEITDKMPELAEAGYTSLWLPPPTKGSGGLSVGYDMWDPFDLGSRDQRGSVRTRYGTEAELLRLVETAHRFGLRVYFDNIMNHRAFDVPGYNENTPIDIYPGMVPEDFHLRITQEGFYRKWDNTRNWNDTWQVQNLGLADLIDIAQEPGTANQNFGAAEGSTGLKIRYLRDPENPQHYAYLPDGTYVGFGENNGITTQMLQENSEYYSEYIEDYLNRAGRWLLDRTKADGFRLDAVKHVRADFFGATFGADKDESNYGYLGQAQLQFNLTRGFTDPNHRDTVFDTEKPRDDAMMFGEHLGEPPGYSSYVDAGMRLVDNPLRQEFNDRLGNPWNGLYGFDQPGWGGFSPAVGVMHAQSHDNDYASRRELQHAFYFTRAGMGLLYTDGNYQAETLGESGGAFPRHANTAFLGQWNDPRIPNLLHIHENFARDQQKGRWSDADFVAYERLDKREFPNMSDEDSVTMLIMLNDNYSSGQARNLTTSFPPGEYLYNYSTYGGGFFKYASELHTVVVPPGGYFVFAPKVPDPAPAWTEAGGRPITILQNGEPAGTIEVVRKDGPNGDPAFSGSTVPAVARPELVPDEVLTDYRYTVRIPRVTDGTQLDFLVFTDGSAQDVLLRLDGGIDLNGSKPSNTRTGAPNNDPANRDNPPALSWDMFLGYESTTFVHRQFAEKFAAIDTSRCKFGSAGAETYESGGPTTNGSGTNPQDADTAAFVYHDPNAGFEDWGGTPDTATQHGTNGGALVFWAKTNSVGFGYRLFIYYTVDGTNPEGAGGHGIGTTRVTEMFYVAPNTPQGDNWWRGEINPAPEGTVKYKIGAAKTTIPDGGDEGTEPDPVPSWYPSSPGAVDKIGQMLTLHRISGFNAGTVVYYPHNDYAADPQGNPLTRTGLDEGFHVLRARAFLNRFGKASLYNTYTQTFYYDAETPSGEIRFPENNGDFVGGSEYGVVVRTDPTVTEVWYQIADEDPSNDDANTNQQAGNGAGPEPFVDTNRNGIRDGSEPFEDLNGNDAWDSNLSSTWARAVEVTPSTAFSPGDPGFEREWRFRYTNIPASGTATIRVRLREASSSRNLTLDDATGHFTTLERHVNTAGPDHRMFVAYPPADGELVGTDYTMKVYFTKSLAEGLTEEQLIQRFLIRTGSNEENAPGMAQPRDNYDILYDETPLYHALAFTFPNLYNDQPDYLHKVEVTYDRPDPDIDLSAVRLVKAVPVTTPRVSIITPPETGSDGRRYEIVLPDVASPLPEDRQFVVRVATGLAATNVTLAFESGTGTFSAPVVSTEGNTKFWDFTWESMTEGSWRIVAEVTEPLGTATDTRNATVVFRQFLAETAADPDDDDDALLDVDENTPQPLPNGRDGTDPNRPVKLNPETWTNGDVHIHYAFGRTSPVSPDSDGDGLPDALELGWRGAVIVGEEFDDVGFDHDGDPETPDEGAGNRRFDWTDTNLNGVHDPGEPSEPFTDTNTNLQFDFGTITAADTDGDGTPNFTPDLDPPFYNTLPDNFGKVPGVNSASEGGDRARQIAGTTTDPNNPDTDNDGLPDGVEDANRNGWLDGDGEPLAPNVDPSLSRNWPNGIREPGETWLETNPLDADTDDDGASDGYGEDVNLDGKIAGDANGNRIWDSGEFWTETDPLNPDTDGDGLPDGWEIQRGLDPLDNGTLSMRTGGPGSPENGADGDPDGDGFTNLQELTNGTDPREDDTAPPPASGSIVIGPGTPESSGTVTNMNEFTDWTIDDLLVLDEYDGDGFNNQGSDVYHAWDGFDSSRDLVAFYMRDGGDPGSGGDGKIYFRADFHDLKPYAEEGNLDLYVVIDTGNPSVGEYALPDSVDTATEMRWEAVVAVYQTNMGAVYVDTQRGVGQNTSVIGEDLFAKGVERRDQSHGSGFGKAYFSSELDAVEFSIQRSALIDAGWNGNAATLNFQVFTTRDGTQNSPPGAGDIGGRSDVRDTIYDDYLASDYWRDQGNISGNKSVLKSWFGIAAVDSFGNPLNDRNKSAKLITLIHETRPIRPGSETQPLLNNGAGAGFHRPLDVHDAYNVPFALHLTPTLASSMEWARVDPSAGKPWLDGPAFNNRLGALASQGIVEFLGTTFSDHIPQYFPDAFNLDNVALAESYYADIYAAAPSASVFYPPERVLSSSALERIAALGFTHAFADQMRHLVKWFGRTSALGEAGYSINRINGVDLFVINDQASSFRFLNHDGGLNFPLRELLSRKARAAKQDQVIVLFSDWSDFGSKAQADAYDINIRWIASRPWIQVVTPGAIAGGDVPYRGLDHNLHEDWSVVDRGSGLELPTVSKDYIDHATQENYDNWYFGQSGREEGLAGKVFELRTGVPLPDAYGQIGSGGLSESAWSTVTALDEGEWKPLACATAHASVFLTAFHNQSNNDLSKFSTGTYIYPDITFQELSPATRAMQSQIRHAAMYARVSTWALDAAAGAYVGVAATETVDLDLDGEMEFLLMNDRLFALLERTGGRMVHAWVRDVDSGTVIQTVGNPLSYSGTETEYEGDTNVTGSQVNAYRTSGLKDWFTESEGSKYVNDVYQVVPALTGTGWTLSSSDGKVAKTIIIQPGTSTLKIQYDLDPSIETLYIRFGLSPDLENLLRHGQEHLSELAQDSAGVDLFNENPARSTRAFIRTGGPGHGGAAYVPGAVDDNPGGGVNFDTVPMRNQAHTHQVEISVVNGATFSIGFQTGEAITYDSDGDGLPDWFEDAHGLNKSVPGDEGTDLDGDGATALQEYVYRSNPGIPGDVFLPAVATEPSQASITFSTVRNRVYQVYYSDTLAADSWQPLGGLLHGDGGTKIVYDDNPSPGRRFYRVEVQSE